MSNDSGMTVAQSGAFVEAFVIEPTASGPLDGLTFAVKDLIDVAGRKTGCGNPTWRDTHPPARSHAVVVEQLLASGARCVGKTITDELAFSLIGENYFYGAPLNPRAPARVTGGSSSGSASAVACGMADFALGTDTGGSVRVPASNCGIWGMRPSHGVVSMAGVMPFAPGFDTVGVLARSAEVLSRAMHVLLGANQLQPSPPKRILVIKEALAQADENCRAALLPVVESICGTFGVPAHEASLAEYCGDNDANDLEQWRDIFCTVQWAEIESCLGGWIAEVKPQFGPVTANNFNLTEKLDRRRVASAICRREALARELQNSVGPSDLLCIPTAPTPAPLKDSGAHHRTGDYYHRALALTSIAGIARLPQVSMPLAEVDGAPYGISLVAGIGEDRLLLAAASAVAASSIAQ
ncbi:MAG: amidase [Pirellulales bacterium]|nr:amidase [Pirellulales bacterium]